jgi:ribose 5-phosphate isomerase RpiB
MRIAIGSDYAGFALKEDVKALLTAERREVRDLGTHSTDPVDYSDYAEVVVRARRVHLGADVAAGLSTLRSALLTALGPVPNDCQHF